jgi:metallo-beta-lactamase family protein
MKPKNEVILQSFGAAQTVTGSKHLLRTPELTIMVDCGLFQGLKELRLKNWDKLPFNPAEVDVVILTHAHLDHCGYIPLFVKSGFKGRILMTSPTKDLVEIILRDSAKIQEEDAARANQGKYSKYEPALPLYTIEDAEKSFSHFETVEHSVSVTLSVNINFQFRKNGHILGSCFIDMNCFGKKIIFSGDIGRYRSEFLLPPSSLTDADYVIMESTYGDRLHGDTDPKEQLATLIWDTYRQHGKVLIPSFAVGRAQELMHLINELKNENKIPFNMAVYLDSPMAANATDILCRYPKWHKLTHDQCMGVCKDVTINKEFSGTREIINERHSKIVISASGMLTGGRVLEYMTHYAPDRKNLIFLIGYQAEGTLGRKLKNGERSVKIYGKQVQVNARVEEISGLSAHADQQEMLQWLSSFQRKPVKIYLVHGEPEVQKVFRAKIKEVLNIEAEISVAGEDNVLFPVE